MGKNVKGGKHHKKHKNKRPDGDTGTKIVYANEDQVYASVLKKVGGSRILVSCSDTKERSGLIPGKFFKRVWMNVGDILLCELNKEDDSQCYIIHKYTNKDANLLKSQGKITFTVNNDDGDEEDGYGFEGNEESSNIPSNGMLDISNIKNKPYIDFPDSDDSDSIEQNNNNTIQSKKWSAKAAKAAKEEKEKIKKEKEEKDEENDKYKNITIDDL